jgi:DtxR family Mn-dependent transcriptional regulator
MSDLIDTTEMYLRTIFELEEEGVVPLRARIAERLEQSGPTVSQTVARMERDGLLSVAGDRHLELTDMGRHIATQVMRRHRLAECLLVEVLKVPLAEVHEEACKWEHVMSDNVERRIMDLLGNPTHSPFGNPIPGITENDKHGLVTLSEVFEQQPAAKVEVEIFRLAEAIQHDITIMDDLAAAAFLPRTRFSVERTSRGFVCSSHTGTVNLSETQAAHVFVKVS